MSKKDFKKGMVAGAAPFEEKFEQQASKLEDIKNDIDQGINIIGNVQEELIDIAEEHDEQIENINKKVQLGLDERESLSILSEKEKEILGGVIIYLSQQYSFNEDQKGFVSNVLRNLGISHPQMLEIDVIENVESIKSQKVIFRVLCELMFLDNSSFDYVADLADTFSISKKGREEVFNEIVVMYNAVGKKGIVKKYCVSEAEVKRHKTYPKLEISTDIETYNEDICFLAELDMSDDFDVECEMFRTESECKTAIENIIYKYYNEEMRYVLPDGDRFIGRKITTFYCNQVLGIVEQVLDFISIHNLRMNVEPLVKIKEEIVDEVGTMAESKINSETAFSVLGWEHYSAGIMVEEVEDFVETLFGGFKEVIRYQESDRGTNVLEVAEKMEQELNMLIQLLQNEVFSYILNRYVIRIKKFVDEINVKTGNS